MLGHISAQGMRESFCVQRLLQAGGAVTDIRAASRRTSAPVKNNRALGVAYKAKQVTFAALATAGYTAAFRYLARLNHQFLPPRSFRRRLLMNAAVQRTGTRVITAAHAVGSHRRADTLAFLGAIVFNRRQQ